MTTLVLHPEDQTTDFLKAIYIGLDFTVINKELSDDELAYQIKNHDRVIFLGHGCSWGLLGWSGFAFHGDLIHALNNNPGNIFIWCNADRYVAEYNLLGFHTGMFISELKEAATYQIDTNQLKINFSNELFANSLRMVIQEHQPLDIYKHIKNEYASESCSVIQFNNERLYFGAPEIETRDNLKSSNLH